MTAENTKRLWQSIPTMMAVLTALVLAVAFAVKADSKAEAALERTNDQEARIRVIENTMTIMQGDMRMVRISIERIEKILEKQK